MAQGRFWSQNARDDRSRYRERGSGARHGCDGDVGGARARRGRERGEATDLRPARGRGRRTHSRRIQRGLCAYRQVRVLRSEQGDASYSRRAAARWQGSSERTATLRGNGSGGQAPMVHPGGVRAERECAGAAARRHGSQWEGVHLADDVQAWDLATLPAGASRQMSSAAKAALRVCVAKIGRAHV